jgi:hypothetical protein
VAVDSKGDVLSSLIFEECGTDEFQLHFFKTKLEVKRDKDKETLEHPSILQQ